MARNTSFAMPLQNQMTMLLYDYLNLSSGDLEPLTLKHLQC